MKGYLTIISIILGVCAVWSDEVTTSIGSAGLCIAFAIIAASEK